METAGDCKRYLPEKPVYPKVVMRTALGLIMTIGMAALGLVAGWFVGNLMEITGIFDPETFWKTDPENVWFSSAIVGGVLGAVAGAIIARRLFSWT